MNSIMIREPNLSEVLECIKTFLLSFGRRDFDNILAEEKTWIYLINKKIAKFLIAEEEDKIIGVGGLFLFQQVGSIGYMGVLEEYRGSGIGTEIFRNLMEIANSSGIETIMLYASKLGEPIYRKYGFRGEYNASMHHLIKELPNNQRISNIVKTIKDIPNWVLSFDEKTMGFDRSDYLKARVSLGAKLLVVENEGYALISKLMSKIRLGPLIASNLDIALQIIRKGINSGAENIIIANHPYQQNKIPSLTLLTESEEDTNLKMVYGKEITRKLDYLYAIGTYAKG